MENEDKQKFRQSLFNKKGKLRKDFFEAEAELSGGSDEEFSEDEDERGMDKLELEEGDMDDIDQDEEAEKVPYYCTYLFIQWKIGLFVLMYIIFRLGEFIKKFFLMRIRQI